MLSLARLEVNALALLQSVILINAKGAESKVINLLTVIRRSDALSIHTPLVDSTFGVGCAMAGEIHVETRVALITVSGNKVESVAVEVSTNARTEAQGFSFLASCKSRVNLNAATISYSIASVLAAEAVSGDRVIGIAEWRNILAEDAIT